MAGLERALLFKNQQVKSLRTWEQTCPCVQPHKPYLPETLSHESWISRIQRLPHLRKFKEGARQRPGRPPGPSETAFRICPFQTMALGSFLGTKESMEAPISKFTPTDRHDKFHRKDDSVSLKAPRKIRARTVGFVFCYHLLAPARDSLLGWWGSQLEVDTGFLGLCECQQHQRNVPNA